MPSYSQCVYFSILSIINTNLNTHVYMELVSRVFRNNDIMVSVPECLGKRLHLKNNSIWYSQSR